MPDNCDGRGYSSGCVCEDCLDQDLIEFEREQDEAWLLELEAIQDELWWEEQLLDDDFEGRSYY